MTRLDFRCDCGAVTGGFARIRPAQGVRYVCHCNDCQAFARFLGRGDVLDAKGGTDVFQTPASRFYIAEGLDRISCVRVTTKPLLRWYADCCKTPIANSYANGRWSFLAIVCHGFDPALRDSALGPVKAHCYTQYALGKPNRFKEINIPAMMLRIASRLLSAWLSGDYRNNVFFDSKTGQPIVQPRQLGKAERKALDTQT